MTASATATAFTIEPCSYEEARALAGELEISEPVALTLVRRGYRTAAAAREFLEAGESHDSFEFDAMEEVVGLLLQAAQGGRTITVHGDYDTDGVCSTAILVAALRDAGAECDWYLPDRLADGYGLSEGTVRRLAARGTGLLLTADCGIACPGEVALARELGLEVVVTDHHEPGERLPDCPILHPRISGYPFGELCATGVAYKLAQAVRERADAAAADGISDLDLVALATVADLVPLRGENRALVRAGLAEIRRARRPGLRALLAAAGCQTDRIDEGDLAFRLAPRLNAAGRLYRADAGVELMLTADDDRAERIADELNRANLDRRFAEREALAGAERALAELPPELREAPALVVAGEGWHPGVVGIVASRLVERHWRPVVVIGLDGSGRGRGSGRSIPGFDLLEGLRACSEHLDRFGGHRAAAGVEVEGDRIDAFRAAFAAHAEEALGPAELVRTEAVDAVVGGESLGLAIAEELEQLAPFGKGNPEPRLLVPAARVRDVRPMGEGKHARFSLESGARRALGVAFGVNGELDRAASGGPLDVAVKLEVNQWNGTVEPRVVLRELFSDAGDRGVRPRSVLDGRRSGGVVAAFRRGARPRPGPHGAAERRAFRAHRRRSPRLLGGRLRRRSALDRGDRPRALRRRLEAPRPRRQRRGPGPVRRWGGGPRLRALRRIADVGPPRGAGCPGPRAGARRLGRRRARSAARRPLRARRGHRPAAVPHLESFAGIGAGYLHLAWGEPDLELALRVHDAEWPLRQGLAASFRALREATSANGGEVSGESLVRALAGDGRHPRTAEQAARRARVLAELGLLRWQGTGASRTLGVVSSEAQDLERSGAYRAFRARHEEGKRFLNSKRQP